MRIQSLIVTVQKLWSMLEFFLAQKEREADSAKTIGYRSIDTGA